MKDSKLELLVYGEIGEDYWTGEGITAKYISAQIAAAGDFDSIVVRVNSPGGSAFEGVAIYNLLRAQGKPIEMIVDGLAASAASVIAMAGDTIAIGLGAMIMIHNAWTFAYGDADDLRKVADTLAKISETIGTIYVDRTKNDAAAIKTLMDAETWMGAEEAVKNGFADSVVGKSEDDSKKAKALAGKFNLSVFKHAPKALQRKAKNAATDCECDCGPCMDGDCAGCEMDPCDSPGCTCPQHEQMRAAAERASTGNLRTAAGAVRAQLNHKQQPRSRPARQTAQFEAHSSMRSCRTSSHHQSTYEGNDMRQSIVLKDEKGQLTQQYRAVLEGAKTAKRDVNTEEKEQAREDGCALR